MMSYIPPFTLTNKIVSLIVSIGEQIGTLSANGHATPSPLLRKVNRVRTIQGSLAMEGNQLSVEQITAILEGKRVIAPAREVQEASNALAVYEQLDSLQFDQERSFLLAHKDLMLGLTDEAGLYRTGGVGVMKNSKVIHTAPPAHFVSKLMDGLFSWLQKSEDHPLIKSCVFHYEFEFIHPFADGNGRMGRLWQMLILKQYHDVFAYLPVESLISVQQTDYYKAHAASTKGTNSAPFIEFMLDIIDKSLQILVQNDKVTPQVRRRVTPQVKPQITPQDTPQVTPQVHRQFTPQDERQVKPQVTPQVVARITPQVTPSVDELLNVMRLEKEQRDISRFKREELQQLLGLSDKKSFTQRYLKPALNAGMIEMTIPDKPTSRLQQYQLTALGEK